MAEQILVSLKRNDRLEQVIPYIEKVAQPGVRVIFLMPYPVEARLWLQDHWVATESPREAVLTGRKVVQNYSWEMQRRLAEHKVFRAQEALRKRGVEIAVDVYTGSLRKVIGAYRAKGNIYLIMMRAGSGFAMMRFVHKMGSLFGLFQWRSFSPMLLLHPDHVAVMSDSPALAPPQEDMHRAQVDKVRAQYLVSMG